MFDQIDLRAVHDERYPDVSTGDALTYKFVAQDLRAYDRMLYDSKWFDYRFMTPIEATCAFIDAFGVVGKRIYSRELDMERAAHITYPTRHNVLRKLLGEKPVDKHRFSAFWKARACADATGMPYEIYIESVITTRMRAWSHTNLPLPSQLTHQIDVEKALKRWEELQASRMHYAEHFAYMPENYRGTAEQASYTSFLVEQARKRSQPDLVIRQMIENDKIAIPALRAEIGEAEYLRIVETRSH